MESQIDKANRREIRVWLISLENNAPKANAASQRILRNITEGRPPRCVDLARISLFHEEAQRQPANLLSAPLLQQSEIIETLLPIAMKCYLEQSLSESRRQKLLRRCGSTES